jgi:leucokinin receptor
MSEVAMLSYRIVMVLVQYLTPLCIISFVYSRMALRLWGSRAPGNAQDSRDANLMKNKIKVSHIVFLLLNDSFSSYDQ